MMLNKLAVPIFVLDVEDEKVFRFNCINETHEKISGMRSADIAGKTPDELLPPRMAWQLNSNYARCIEKRAEHTYEEFLALPTGEKWWLTTLTPILDDAGKIVQIVAVAADITERKLLELEQSKKQAEMAHRAELMTTYTKTAAHDLRSPLCQLDLMLQMILVNFEDLGDGKKDLLQKSQGVIENSIKYLDAVFEYSRSMVELGEGQLSTLDFGHLCGDLLSILDPNGRHSVEYPNLVLTADSTVTQVILRNLLDNAIKHNPGQELSIAIEVAVETAGKLRFRVTDNGRGFSRDYDITSGGNRKGGFGLKGARKLALGLGGNLWLEEPDQGGAVCFVLPGKLASEEQLDRVWQQYDKMSGYERKTLAA